MIVKPSHIVPIIAAATPHVCTWLGFVGPLKSWGNEALTLLLMVNVLAILSLPVVTLVAIYFVLKRRWRPGWLLYIVTYIALMGVVPSGYTARLSEVEKFTRRSQPLIEAIRVFERERGAPPALLSELVPTYIAAIPKTGFGAFPEYEYQLCSRELGGECYGNSWRLLVSCPVGILNFDEVLFLPNGAYPERTVAGAIVRVNGWGYLVE